MARFQDNEDVGCWLAEQLGELDLNKSMECMDVAVFTVISEGNVDQSEYALGDETIYVVTDLVIKILMAFSKEQLEGITNSEFLKVKGKDGSNVSLVNHCVLLRQFRLVARAPKNKVGRTELVLASEVVEFLDTYEELELDLTKLIWYDDHPGILRGIEKFKLPVSALKRVETAVSVPLPLQESSSPKNVGNRDEETLSESDTTCNEKTPNKSTRSPILVSIVKSVEKSPQVSSFSQGTSTSKNVGSCDEGMTLETDTACNNNPRLTKREIVLVSTSKPVKKSHKVLSFSQGASMSKDMESRDKEMTLETDTSRSPNLGVAKSPNILVSVLKEVETSPKISSASQNASTSKSVNEGRISKSNTTGICSSIETEMSSFTGSFMKRIETSLKVPTSSPKASTSKNVNNQNDGMILELGTKESNSSSSTFKQLETSSKVLLSTSRTSTSRNVNCRDRGKILRSNTTSVSFPKAAESSPSYVCLLDQFRTPPRVLSSHQNGSTSKYFDSDDEEAMTQDTNSTFSSNYNRIIDGDDPDETPRSPVLGTAPHNGKAHKLDKGTPLMSSNKNLISSGTNSPIIQTFCPIMSPEKNGSKQILTTNVWSQGFHYRTPEHPSGKKQSSSKKRLSEDTVTTTCRKVISYVKHKKRLDFSTHGTRASIDDSQSSKFLKKSKNNKQIPTCTVTSNSSEKLILDEPQTEHVIPRVRRLKTSSLISSIGSVPQSNAIIECVNTSSKRVASNASVSTQTDLTPYCHNCHQKTILGFVGEIRGEERLVSTPATVAGIKELMSNNKKVRPNKSSFHSYGKRSNFESPIYEKEKPIKKKKRSRSLMQLKFSDKTKTNFLDFIHKYYVEETHNEMKSLDE